MADYKIDSTCNGYISCGLALVAESFNLGGSVFSIKYEIGKKSIEWLGRDTKVLCLLKIFCFFLVIRFLR